MYKEKPSGYKLKDSMFCGHIEHQDSEIDSDEENLLDDLIGGNDEDRFI